MRGLFSLGLSRKDFSHWDFLVRTFLIGTFLGKDFPRGTLMAKKESSLELTFVYLRSPAHGEPSKTPWAFRGRVWRWRTRSSSAFRRVERRCTASWLKEKINDVDKLLNWRWEDFGDQEELDPVSYCNLKHKTSTINADSGLVFYLVWRKNEPKPVGLL